MSLQDPLDQLDGVAQAVAQRREWANGVQTAHTLNPLGLPDHAARDLQELEIEPAHPRLAGSSHHVSGPERRGPGLLGDRKDAPGHAPRAADELRVVVVELEAVRAEQYSL